MSDAGPLPRRSAGGARSRNRRLPWFMIALPFVLSLLLNLPALNDSFMPTRDTFFVFSGFGAFAKHLRQFGEVPLWMPTSAFGGPSDWRQMQLLSPCNWLATLAAAAFGATDLLWWFKVSVLVEQSLYGLGCVWLAGLLFRRTTAKAFFVVAAVMASGSWSQILSNLRLVAPIPWMIGLLLLAFRRKSRALLLASLLPVPIAAYGNSYYLLAYFGLLWSVALGLQLVLHREGGFAWLTARPERRVLLREAAVAAALISLVVIVLGQFLLVLAGQVPVAPMRDPLTGRVNLPVYLGYGYSTNLPILVYSFALATPDAAHNEEAYLYVGMTAFSLALLGAALARSRSVRLVKWLLLFSVVFACSGFLTIIFYWLPLMSHFRHVAYTGIVARLLLCLAGAFGVQFLLDATRRQRLAISPTVVRTPALVAIFFNLSLPVASIMSVPAAKAGRVEIGPGNELVLSSLAAGLIFGLGIWAAARFLPRRRAVAGVAALVLGSAIASAWLLHGKIFERETWRLPPDLAAFARGAINAPLSYVPMRGGTDSGLALQFVPGLAAHGARYDTMDSMISRDAPATGERNDVVPERTARLLQMKREAPEAFALYSQPLQRKVFLAEDARDVVAAHQLQPGEILVEAGDRPLVAWRRDVAIEVRDYSFNHVTFVLPAVGDRQDPARRRFLVYMDSLHPDWRASVDGRAAAIHAANIAFKAVELPPGAREVSFRFGDGLRHTLALLNALGATLAFALQVAGLLFLEGVFVRPEDGAPST